MNTLAPLSQALGCTDETLVHGDHVFDHLGKHIFYILLHRDSDVLFSASLLLASCLLSLQSC